MEIKLRKLAVTNAKSKAEAMKAKVKEQFLEEKKKMEEMS